MSKIILWGLVALLWVQFGEQLTCIKSKVSQGSTSDKISIERCKFDHNCATIKKETNKTTTSIEKKCVNHLKCKMNDSEIVGSLNYTVTTVCCKEDLCNKGS
uniref:Sperm acrosome membrane-associated protein 4-like n=1 Tax=Geotrypetes seraphini TaxID=260995 RepID=A0A6P8NVL9_GEOSA|nr:sperm acrosome membrane-associated protein 4-like [Geotrypetes seraphini]